MTGAAWLALDKQHRQETASLRGGVLGYPESLNRQPWGMKQGFKGLTTLIHPAEGRTELHSNIKTMTWRASWRGWSLVTHQQQTAWSFVQTTALCKDICGDGKHRYWQQDFGQKTLTHGEKTPQIRTLSTHTHAHTHTYMFVCTCVGMV